MTPRFRLGRDIFEISLFIFATDLVYGIIAPTFSLFVHHAGGSTALVGALAATVGITRLAASLPAGLASDRWGRKAVLVGGVIMFFAACVLFTLPSDPRLLFGPRIVFGLGILATFPLGIAYIGDVVPRERQTVAISVYVSAQGLGYGLGPLVGGWLASNYGFDTAYRLAACIALATAITAVARLRPGIKRRPKVTVKGNPFHALRSGRPILIAATLSNVFVMLMFNGTIIPFLSLYAARAGMSTIAIGVLYGARSIASMLVRVPTGILGSKFSMTQLMLLALITDACAGIGIAATTWPVMLTVAAVVDGMAFGVYLASSQSVVARASGPDHRGAAIGAYAMGGALGETIGAVSFGVIAQIAGLRAIFIIAGLLLAGSAPAIWRLTSRSRLEEGAAAYAGH